MTKICRICGEPVIHKGWSSRYAIQGRNNEEKRTDYEQFTCTNEDCENYGKILYVSDVDMKDKTL